MEWIDSINPTNARIAKSLAKRTPTAVTVELTEAGMWLLTSNKRVTLTSNFNMSPLACDVNVAEIHESLHSRYFSDRDAFLAWRRTQKE